jgi:hypothetical protein
MSGQIGKVCYSLHHWFMSGLHIHSSHVICVLAVLNQKCVSCMLFILCIVLQPLHLKPTKSTIV